MKTPAESIIPFGVDAHGNRLKGRIFQIEQMPVVRELILGIPDKGFSIEFNVDIFPRAPLFALELSGKAFPVEFNPRRGFRPAEVGKRDKEIAEIHQVIVAI